jgi:hypothetical protein
MQKNNFLNLNIWNILIFIVSSGRHKLLYFLARLEPSKLCNGMERFKAAV